MDSALRPMGIEGVGVKPWGAHFCVFYETKEDLLDLLVPYFKAGLEHHEFCLCVASEPVLAEEAERALRNAVPDFERHLANGQIEIISHLHWYLTDGHFDPLRVRQGWIDKLEQGLARGYAGMRFAANIFWLERQDWDRFAEYEAQLDEVFSKLRIMALCAYSVARCSAADMLDVVRHHQFSLARRHGSSERLEGPELQRANGEIRRLNADLERRVAERTAQLTATNEQLKREIAERQRAEDRLRLVLDTIPAMVFTALPDGSIDYVNQSGQHYMGLPLENMRGWGWEATIHPDDRARSINLWRAAMTDGQSSENELRVRRADGKYRWTLGRFVPLREGSGKIVKWYGVTTDIDDRKRAEASAMASEERLQRAIECAAIPIMIHAEDGRVVQLSKVWTEITGYSPAELPTIQAWVEKAYGEQAGMIQAHIQGLFAMEQGAKDEGEFHVRTRQGETRLWAFRSAPLGKLSTGQRLVISTAMDITTRKRVEEKLRESADHLQHLSRRLLEVQEMERRHLARELHDEVGQMLTGLMLVLKQNDEMSIDTVKTRFEQARSIVAELLERVRGLSFDLRPAALDQLGLLPALLALFERYTAQTGVLVNFRHNGLDQHFVPEVETTAYRTVQEALTNVARHAGVAGVTVRVWASAEMLNLQIEDQGRGFDSEVALAIPRSGGLAGMQERVLLLDGHLTIESRPGAGAHITAELPLRGHSPEGKQ